MPESAEGPKQGRQDKAATSVSRGLGPVLGIGMEGSPACIGPVKVGGDFLTGPHEETGSHHHTRSSGRGVHRPRGLQATNLHQGTGHWTGAGSQPRVWGHPGGRWSMPPPSGPAPQNPRGPLLGPELPPTGGAQVAGAAAGGPAPHLRSQRLLWGSRPRPHCTMPATQRAGVSTCHAGPIARGHSGRTASRCRTG